MKAIDLHFRSPHEMERSKYLDAKAKCNSCGRPIGDGYLISKTSLGSGQFLAIVVCNEKCRVAFIWSPNADAAIEKAIRQINQR